MNINDLEIDEDLKVTLNSLLLEFETFKEGEKVNLLKEEIIVEPIIETQINKTEKKSLLNNFFKKFFTTEYEFQ